MARPIYFPRMTAMLPPVRIEPPQDTSGTTALAAGLSAITDVANNWRQKQQSVEQAKRTADALEREGLTQEARLYRSAADNFSVNFFATPAENQKFNKSLITDTLSLLEAKQNRELKQAQINAMAQTRESTLENRQSLIQDRLTDNARADRALQLQEETATENREERKAARQERASISEENAIRAQLAQIAQEESAVMARRDSGQLDQNEFARALSPIIDRKFQTEQRLSDIISQRSGSPTVPPVRGSIPELKTKAERQREENEVSRLKAQEIFSADPTVSQWTDRETGITHVNPKVIVRSAVDKEGNTSTSTTTITPSTPSPTTGTIPRDPTLNLE